MSTDTFSIRHRIELETTPKEAFEALTTQPGLAAWWTPMVEAEPEQGSIARFRFGDGKHGPDMEVVEIAPNERLRWHCVEGPWKGMDFVFELATHERGSVLVFSHVGWPDQGDFYMHCNAKWGFFLAVSLKRYLETGKGRPHPEDPSI